MATNLPDPAEAGAMSFWDHIRELRKRILYSVGGVAAGFTVAYVYSKELFALLRIPYDQAYRSVYNAEPNLINTSLLEGFMVYLKIGFVGGLFLASPFVFYQVWKFISPGLKPSERRYVVPFVTAASVFFVGGALFGYFWVFPPSFEFFLNVTKGQSILPSVRMEEYYQLAAWMLIGFGAAFELPLIALCLVAAGILRARHLVKHWRGIVVAIFVLSAVITPTPDIGTMMMMAVPLLVLYVATIAVAYLLEMFRRQR